MNYYIYYGIFCGGSQVSEAEKFLEYKANQKLSKFNHIFLHYARATRIAVAEITEEEYLILKFKLNLSTTCINGTNVEYIYTIKFDELIKYLILLRE